MVSPFQFSKIPQIWFGTGKIDLLPGLISRYGKSILLVTGDKSLIQSGIGDVVNNSLKNKGIISEIIRIKGEPSPAMIDDTITMYRDQKPDVVVAIGGGSVMDAGKAISAMITVADGVTNYLEGAGTKSHPGTKVPFIAVPTTSGTGSEATKNAVISEVGKNGFKRSLRHDNFIPDIAIVDPNLTISCPAELTATGGMDCYTQLVEAFLSDKANGYTDALALRGIAEVSRSLEKVFMDGGDMTSRSSMAFAAMTSGICLANAGLGVVHGFASSIGGRINIPHGTICGTLMAVSNEITVRKLIRGEGDRSFLVKYARLGELITGEGGKSGEYYIDMFIDHLHKLTSVLRLPGLKAAGLTWELFEEICSHTDNKNNPVKLTQDDMLEILTRRFN